MLQPDKKLLFQDVLKGVSRSFYLTLRILPLAVREPIALAYLLARAADTLADTTVLPSEQRLLQLHRFKALVAQPDRAGDCSDIQSALQGQLDNQDEQRLLALLPKLFELLALQTQQDQALIRQVVAILTDGMVFDLDSFPAEESGEILALQRQDELDRYTYLVAGCVGEFWTQVSMAHVTALSHWDSNRLTELGVAYGQGLQMTNILRDLPRDLRIGRCYLPQAWLEQHQLSIELLLDKSNSELARPLLQQGIGLALQQFEAAQDYVLAIPRHCIRLRLAALWPLLIGLGTLAKLSASNHWLDVDATIKVDRNWVYKMMLKSLFMVGSNSLLRSWIEAETKKYFAAS